MGHREIGAGGEGCEMEEDVTRTIEMPHQSLQAAVEVLRATLEGVARSFEREEGVGERGGADMSMKGNEDLEQGKEEVAICLARLEESTSLDGLRGGSAKALLLSA